MWNTSSVKMLDDALGYIIDHVASSLTCKLGIITPNFKSHSKVNGIKQYLHIPGVIQDTITSSLVTDFILCRFGLEVWTGGRAPLLFSFGPPTNLSLFLSHCSELN